ncbi:hypothetical protein [Desmospora activa]|uniref:Uncharacterized protein n=1 Tax=Desmospora activa DSM 45169 TaxID=1121389 RepID=A0A2T4ZCU4_9BACL|nr:hypothetical protein [Desmospora activa]PTM59711.1 hypothetical protein C8J48_2341 [Desmospora activa DSM 45169]
MAHLSVQEISSWLTSRFGGRVKSQNQNEQVNRPHQNWDDQSRASLVILWGLLVYPRLDPDWREPDPSVQLSEVYRLFNEHLGSTDQWETIVHRLEKYDYIRRRLNDTVVAGTRLWTAVDASRMYPLFRRSVLYRKQSPDNDQKTAD